MVDYVMVARSKPDHKSRSIFKGGVGWHVRIQEGKIGGYILRKAASSVRIRMNLQWACQALCSGRLETQGYAHSRIDREH
jgi:hypothetical protein